MRDFGDGSGRRLCQDHGPRLNVDLRYRRALLDKRTQKYARFAGSSGQGASAHDLQNRIVDDDVSLLAGRLQRRDAQDLLRRLAVLLTRH